jgi:hypothetical protein
MKSFVAVVLLSLGSFAQTVGSIEGTVVDEYDQHVKAGIRVTAGPIGVGWGGGCCPQADTDEYGHFRFNDLLLISWAVSAHKEAGEYGHSDIGFYGDTVEVKLTPKTPIATDITVRIPAKPAMLEGEVEDASTDGPVRSVFIFNRPGAGGYMRASVDSKYSIVLPSNTDIQLRVVEADGYKPWTSPRSLNIEPEHHVRLDVKLQPDREKK